MTTKEHTMTTTVDTSHESMILTIDEAAAYLAIPKATLYNLADPPRRVRPTCREDGRLPALPPRGPRRVDRRASRARSRRVGPWPGHHSPSARGGPSLPRRSATAATAP
ncbi:helix-turn-helix domain-containing protein [Nocardioides sp. MJB4]|uniref:Helix-turn-helix domain-containing protein n=1 Tax=Nocardioides donggukensis TaxID=2774019 RepID=A0A927K5D4_9ACTN|nr:helix-turn-helix domain-containing protein [Nocardioides donggukensis]